MSGMTQRKAANPKVSKRKQQYDAMLRDALSRPSIREVMKVYHGWQEKDQGLDAYRAAVKEPEQITTTNYSNAPSWNAPIRQIYRHGCRC